MKIAKRLAHNKIEMLGRQFNSWLVLSEVPGSGKVTGGVKWICKCLECKDDYIVSGANLRSGLSKRCVKCGCGHSHSKQIGQTRTKRTSQESAYYYLYLQLKKSAKKRKLEWRLTEQAVKEIVNKNCIYCGTKPSLKCNPLKHQGLSQRHTDGAVVYRNGIDRINSSIGYLPDNCVPACETCNKAKLDYSFDDFKAWIQKVARHLNIA